MKLHSNLYYRNFFIASSLLAISFFFFFIRNFEYIIFLFLVTLYYFFKKDIKIDNFIYLYIFIYGLVQIAQYIKFDFLPITVYLGLHLRIFTAYFCVKIIDDDFVNINIKVIYFFGCISLFFYSICVLFPQFTIFMINNITPHFTSFFEINNNVFNIEHSNKNIIIFNFHGLTELLTPRNSGPYWEPGVNAGICTIALIFNYLSKGIIRSKENVVFLLNIITSFSTTGYFLLVLFFIFFTKQSLFTRSIYFSFILLVSVLSFNTFDFLGDKINKQLQGVEISESGYSLVKVNRFGSALVDLYDFKEHPFFGRGRSIETRIKNFSNRFDYADTHRNNGITHYLVSYGIFIFIFFIYLLKKSFNSLCIYYNRSSFYSSVLLFMILIMSFSELYFRRPFFIALTLLFLVYSGKKNDINESFKK